MERRERHRSSLYTAFVRCFIACLELSILTSSSQILKGVLRVKSSRGTTSVHKRHDIQGLGTTLSVLNGQHTLNRHYRFIERDL